MYVWDFAEIRLRCFLDIDEILKRQWWDIAKISVEILMRCLWDNHDKVFTQFWDCWKDLEWPTGLIWKKKLEVVSKKNTAREAIASNEYCHMYDIITS